MVCWWVTVLLQRESSSGLSAMSVFTSETCLSTTASVKIPAIVLTHIIYRIVRDGSFAGLDKTASVKSFVGIVTEALELLPCLLVMHPVSQMTWNKETSIDEVFHNDVERQRELVERALFLIENDLSCYDLRIKELPTLSHQPVSMARCRGQR